jgi:hypothetical protein
MSLLDLSGAARVGSARHRRTRLRGSWLELTALVLRLASASLLVAVGWIHLHLWQEGYRLIPTIGPLFLAAAITAFVVAAALAVRPVRLVGVVGLATLIGILGGLIVSINVGLFGFKESLAAPFAVESIVLELAAAVSLAGWIIVDLRAESRQQSRQAGQVQTGQFYASKDSVPPGRR